MIETIFSFYYFLIRFFTYGAFVTQFLTFILYFFAAFFVVLYVWEFENKLTNLFHKNYIFNFVSGILLFKPLVIFIRAIVKDYRPRIEVRSKFLYYVIPVLVFSVSISNLVFLVFLGFVTNAYIFNLLFFAIFTTLFIKLMQIMASFNNLNADMGLVFRILFQIISFLPIFMVHCLTIIVIFGANTIFTMPKFGTDIYFSLILAVTGILFFILIMIMTSKSPFNVVSTRSMKITDEMGYNGIFLLFMELVNTANLLIWSTVFVLLFLGGAIPFFVIPAMYALFLKIFLVYFAIIKISLVLGNYTIHKIVNFSWFGILPFSLVWLLFDIYFFGIA